MCIHEEAGGDQSNASGGADASPRRSGYALDAAWPHYPEDMQFEMGSGVAVDSDDIVYVFTRDVEHWAAHPLAMADKMGKSSVSMFDRSGAYLGKWGTSDQPGFALGGHTIYIDDDGMFWIVDRDGHTVRRYHPDGTLSLSLGTFAEWGDGPDHFNGPTAVVVQPNGNIVVSDGYWNSRLVWFSPDGEFIREVGHWGRGPAEFNTPHALAQDTQGRLLVADLCGGNFHDYMTLPGQIAPHRVKPDPDCVHRIQRLDPDGNFIDQWTHVVPLSIAVYGEQVYASDKMRNLAILDAESGAELDRVEDIAIYIHQLAMDTHGDLYTATVYPEHGGARRGRAGPSNRRWTRDKQAA